MAAGDNPVAILFYNPKYKEPILTKSRLSFVLFFAIFTIYLWALSPSIYVGDSSLFAAASFSLGSAHPPGYPLYILIGKLFTFLPFGNVAYKVNLACAFFGSLTCLMVFKVSMELTENRYASWASALICGISPVFFLESVKAEVYTLNSFLAMIIFYLGLKILNLERTTQGDEQRAKFLRLSMLGFFIIGIGMGNHHTIGFMGLIFLLPIASRWRDISLKWLILSPIFFSIGFSINLLLYFRSIAITESGGLMLYSYAGTLKDFLKVLLRQAYNEGSTPNALSQAISFSEAWFYGLKNSLYHVALPGTSPVLPILFLGFIGLFKRPKIFAYFAFSVIIWFLLLGRMVIGDPKPKVSDIQIVSVYFLPAIPMLYSLISVGFALIAGFFKRGMWKILPGFIPYAIAALPFVFLPFSFGPLNLSSNFLAYDYGRDMLTTLPLKSLLMNYSDNPMFTVFYMRVVERLREDMLVMGTVGKKDTYGIESSPYWKYAGLYPDFYGKEKSSVKEIDRDFAIKGRLFANSPRLTEVVSEHYTYYPYILTVALYPKQKIQRDKIMKDSIINKIKLNYSKINCERTIDLPDQEDFLAKELQAGYSFTTMVYGDLIKRTGDEKGGMELYKRAFLMGEPKLFLWPYIYFLLTDGRESEAFSLIKEIKQVGGYYGKFAEVLEMNAASVVKGRANKNAEKNDNIQ